MTDMTEALRCCSRAGFVTARRAVAGIEAMAMLAEGQARGVRSGDAPPQRAFVLRIFGFAA